MELDPHFSKDAPVWAVVSAFLGAGLYKLFRIIKGDNQSDAEVARQAKFSDHLMTTAREAQARADAALVDIAKIQARAVDAERRLDECQKDLAQLRRDFGLQEAALRAERILEKSVKRRPTDTGDDG